MKANLVVRLRLVGPDRYGNFDYDEDYDYEIDYEDDEEDEDWEYDYDPFEFDYDPYEYDYDPYEYDYYELHDPCDPGTVTSGTTRPTA